MKKVILSLVFMLIWSSSAYADGWVFNGQCWVWVVSPPPVVIYIPQNVTNYVLVPSTTTVMVPYVVGNRPILNYDDRFFYQQTPRINAHFGCFNNPRINY
jgi:hypothetical protein